MATEINNSEDIIDSRDVIARIEELEGERGALKGEVDEATATRDEMPAERGPEPLSDAYHDAYCAVLDASEALAEWDEDNGDELDALKALAKEAEGYAGDWNHGEVLIRDSYFTNYAQQLADDLGMVDVDAGWPGNCIDWEQAARELKMDYSAVDFDGVTYWIR